MTGTTIQHYLVGERLGAGGMGEVYLAEDTRLGRPVALKFLAAGSQDDPDRRERLMTEARAASSLRSSNIAAIYDIGEHDGSIFIVMEYVEGELLSVKIARGPLPVREAIDIGLQIADALDEAHSRGVIHRDIKSANIMITARGQAKILDFGLARFIRRGNASTQGGIAGEGTTVLPPVETMPGMLMGTVLYMSPEQALAKPVDQRSDIFSLGVVLFEMLAARLPFAGDSLTAVIDQVLHQPPAALARFNYSVSPELEGIIRKCLEKDASFRYQSARDLYIDLHRIRAGLEAAWVVEGSSAALRDGSSDQDRGAAAQPNSIAVIAFSNISKEPADEWIGSGIAETVMADLKNIHGLSVIGRERIFDALRGLGSSDAIGPDERFAIDIGRGLGATWIVGGGYQRFGDLIRITARLVEVKSGALLKTVKIDGKTSEIFDLQDRIVYELSQGLNLRLDRSTIAEIEKNETNSVAAYESYSRGMMMLRQGTRDSLDRAVYLFEKATEHDPKYAEAWAALGDAYDLKASFLSLRELYDKAIKFGRQAVELNPRLTAAYINLGSAYLGASRFDEAIDAVREAIRIEPGNAAAHSALARAYFIGRAMFEEALVELEHVVAINPEAGYAHLTASLLHALLGHYDLAEASSRRAIELQEQYVSGTAGLLIVGAHTRLGYVHYRRGDYDEAITEYQRELMFLASTEHALRERTSIELYQKLGAAHLRKGERDEADRFFKLAVKGFESRIAKGADDPFTKYYVASVYGLRGDAERAVRYLNETLVFLPALNRRRAGLDPDFDPVREHPGFQALLAPAPGRSS